MLCTQDSHQHQHPHKPCVVQPQGRVKSDEVDTSTFTVNDEKGFTLLYAVQVTKHVTIYFIQSY